MNEVYVKGLSDLDAFLKQLPAKVEANVMRGGLRAGAKILEAEVKQNLTNNGSVDTGQLLKGIKVGTRSRRGRITAAVRVTGDHVDGDQRLPNALIAYWLEFTGAAQHLIKARKSRFLVFFGKYARVVQHPGFPAKPFMVPALQSKATEAVIAVGNHIKQRLATKHGLNTADVEVRGE
jgi:hypothetical protein